MIKFDFLVDFDTPLVSAAAVLQQNKLITTHIKSGKQKEWENKTEFNLFLKENPKWVEEDFILEVKSYRMGNPQIGVDMLLNQMQKIKESEHAKSAKFVISGEHGNFRYDVAKIQPYKGQRPPKPLLFEKIKKELIRQGGTDIIQPDGKFESDDLLSMYLYKEPYDTNKAISFIDKDLKTVVGWSNSFKTMEQPIYTNEFEAFYNLATQTLTGDISDNIQGIPFQSENVIKRFGLRKSKGFGKASAKKCLEGVESIEDVVERLVFVYSETFKNGVITEDGVKLDWLDMLDENVKLLKMLDYVGQDYIFSKEFGIIR